MSDGEDDIVKMLDGCFSIIEKIILFSLLIYILGTLRHWF